MFIIIIIVTPPDGFHSRVLMKRLTAARIRNTSAEQREDPETGDR